MSHSSLPLASGRNEDTTERLSHGSAPHQADQKQSAEAIIAESKRLIKSGFYKKAFQLIENFKSDLSAIPPVAHMKLCRRMVIALTRICSRYLIKGELQRVDHFIKLMNKSYEYIETWHDLLCNYVSKTNPKYKHLQRMLDEVSESYEDALEAEGLAKAKPGRNMTQNNSSFFSASDSRETRPSSFVNKLKHSLSNSIKDNKPQYLEDISHLDGEVRMMTETLTGTEINITFHLDEFIKYYLCTLLNWANFFKKISKKYDLAFRFLTLCNKISKELDSCLDPDLLHLIAKIRLGLGVFYCEFGKYEEALRLYESALNLLQIEVSLRIGRSKEARNAFIMMFKFKDTIRLLVLVFMNMATVYELKDNYSRALESLRVGAWFGVKFLTPDEEAYQFVNAYYNVANQKYDKFLKELGEIERIAGEKNEPSNSEGLADGANSDHFAKMNSYLYNKFNYDRLNLSQYIVLTSDGLKLNNRSEILLEDKVELGDAKLSWSKLKDYQSEGSVIKAGLAEDNESPNVTNAKRPSTTTNKTTNKDRKKNKAKILAPPEEVAKPLTSEKYKSPELFEKEKEEMEIDSEEEREYIAKLNRNIKDKKKSPIKKNQKLTINTNNTNHDYLDVDGYFEKVVDQKIKEKEEDLKLHQPTDFKHIVKNYAFFLKTEKFDDVEFDFAERALTAKARENFGDCTIQTKYKPPTFKVEQRNEVKIEAQHTEAKFEAENKINQRNLNFKNFIQSKSPQSKSVKFVPEKEERENKVGTLVTIDEQTTTNKSPKNTFTSILLKHRENLGLNSLHASIKERERKEIKERELEKEAKQMKMLGLLQGQTPKPQITPKQEITSYRESNFSSPQTGYKKIDPEMMRKFSQTTKNTIQLLMEAVEKNIDEDEDIKRRIEESKPLIDIQKPNNKFLKVTDELAKSTANLSIKTDATKKIRNFSQLVRTAQVMSKKTVMIKAPSKLNL